VALTQLKPALQYSEGRSKPWSGAKLVNCFAEKADGDKQADFAVMAIPGLVPFSDITSGAVRGTHVMGDLLYVVAGAHLYSVSSSGGSILIGDILPGGPVRMVDNGTELAIAAAPIGYVYSGGTLQIPPDLPQITDVAYIDSYFVWVVFDSDQCIYSGIDDGLSYDFLDVFTAEGSPDPLIAIVNDHRELQLYGSSTIEIFYNAGGSDNVFERQGNAFIERGCFDRDSTTKIDNSVQFFGDDRIIYRLDGYTPVRISTHSIEYKLRNATYARGFTYTQEGHKFYVLTSDAGTFAYDMATGAWHERKSWLKDNWRVGGAVPAWNRVILSDAYVGKLYTPDLDVFDEDGETISVEIDLPSLGDSVMRRTCYAFIVNMETGVGLNDGQGSDPQIMMRFSKNGGRTYSNELWRSMGVIGDYLRRAVWRSLGQFYQLDIRLVMTDPVRRFVIDYYADVR
jgi:hypothetical protein